VKSLDYKGEKEFFLAASTLEERQEWINALSFVSKLQQT